MPAREGKFSGVSSDAVAAATGRNWDEWIATEFMADLQGRLARRVTIITDGLDSYIEAIERNFGSEVDYAQLVRQYEGERGQYSGAERTVITGFPAMGDVSTSYVERHNLTTRVAVRRYTRKTNG